MDSVDARDRSVGEPDAGENGVQRGAEPGAGTNDATVDTVTDEDTATPSPFPHPPWTVELVLVAGAITLLFGILVSPVWLLVGSPFVLALFLWLYIRLFVRR